MKPKTTKPLKIALCAVGIAILPSIPGIFGNAWWVHIIDFAVFCVLLVVLNRI